MSWDISPVCRETPVRDVLSQHTAPATILMSRATLDRCFGTHGRVHIGAPTSTVIAIPAHAELKASVAMAPRGGHGSQVHKRYPRTPGLSKNVPPMTLAIAIERLTDHQDVV
jgi:hypothetical protein